MIGPLDKRIAELKGWRPSRPWEEIQGEWSGARWLDSEGNRTKYAVIGFCDSVGGPHEHFSHSTDVPEWSPSTDDAQALELVDELGLDFRLEGKPGAWSAVIDYYGQHHQEVGDSRPEAICRAYIAAREWIAMRRAEDVWRKGEEAKDEALADELRESARKYEEDRDGMATKEGA